MIWDYLHEEDFTLPLDKPLTVASYAAGTETVAYVDPVAVGAYCTFFRLCRRWRAEASPLFIRSSDFYVFSERPRPSTRRFFKD